MKNVIINSSKNWPKDVVLCSHTFFIKKIIDIDSLKKSAMLKEPHRTKTKQNPKCLDLNLFKKDEHFSKYSHWRQAASLDMCNLNLEFWSVYIYIDIKLVRDSISDVCCWFMPVILWTFEGLNYWRSSSGFKGKVL